MKQILIIESSPGESQSASRQLTEALRGRLKAQYPEAKIVKRDLAKESLPHLDYATVKAIFTRDHAEAESLKEVLRLSDQLTEEVLSSDFLVIAAPTWNFGLPSSLKAWIDHIVRPGKTFRYVGGGAKGTCDGEEGDPRACFRRGFYRRTLEIMGYRGALPSLDPGIHRKISDVQTVRAEGMNIPTLAPHAIPVGTRAVETLVI